MPRKSKGSKKKRDRAVNYEVVPKNSELGKLAYKLLDETVRKHHTHLNQATIGVAWHKALKPDVDGHITLGRCVKVGDMHKEFCEFDFIIVLNKDIWFNDRFDESKKRALMDHELCHAEVATDKNGDDVADERGRPVYRIRKHDIEEFTAVIRRHGCYKADLEVFARAIVERGTDTLFGKTPEPEFKPTTPPVQ